MTNPIQNLGAAIAALAIVTLTWAPVITVPAAKAATLIAPVMA